MDIIENTEELIDSMFNRMGFLYEFELKGNNLHLVIGFDVIFIRIKAGIDSGDDYTKLFFEYNGVKYEKWIKNFSIVSMVKVLLLFIKAILFNDKDAMDDLNAFTLTKDEIQELVEAKYKAKMEIISDRCKKLTKRMEKYKKIRKRDEREKKKLKKYNHILKVELLKI